MSEGKPSFKPVGGRGRPTSSRWTTPRATSSSTSRRRTTTRSSRAAGSGAGSSTAVARGRTSPPDALPASFAKIPPDSDIGDVRASVPGTDEAEDARPRRADPADDGRQARRGDAPRPVRRRAEVRRRSTARRPSTRSTRPTSVLRIRGRYYACDNAVWFVGRLAERARGCSRTPFRPTTSTDSAERARLQREVRAHLRRDAGRRLLRLHAGIRRALPVGRHRRLGHRLALPAVDRAGLLVAASVHVGHSTRTTPVVRLGLRRLVELPVLQRELRLGRLVPAQRLVAAAVRRLGPWRRVAPSRRLGLVSDPGGYRPPTVIASHYWGSRGGGAWNRPLPNARPGAVRPAGRPIPGVRPDIGFRPPTKDIRPPGQSNIYNRLPAKSRDVPRPPSAFERPSPVHGPAEQRVRGQERRGLPPDEGRTVAAARGQPLEDGGRPDGKARRPDGRDDALGVGSFHAPRAGSLLQAGAQAGARTRLLGASARRRPHARPIRPSRATGATSPRRRHPAQERSAPQPRSAGRSSDEKKK